MVSNYHKTPRIKQFINLAKDTSPQYFILYITGAEKLYHNMIMLHCHDQIHNYIRVMLPKYISILISDKMCLELENKYRLLVSINNKVNIICIKKFVEANENYRICSDEILVKLHIGNECIVETHKIPFNRYSKHRKVIIKNNL